MLTNRISLHLKNIRPSTFSSLRQLLTRPLSTTQNFPLYPETKGPSDLEKLLLDPSPSSSSSLPVSSSSQLPQDAPAKFEVPPPEDPLLSYIVNTIMRDGRKQTAQKRVSKMLLHINAFTRAPPLPIVRKAIEMAAPSVRVVTMKKGGKSSYHPRALGEKQRTRYGLKWILQASNSRTGKTLEERLAREIVAILRGDKSSALDNKEKMHILAMSNRGSLRI